MYIIHWKLYIPAAPGTLQEICQMQNARYLPTPAARRVYGDYQNNPLSNMNCQPPCSQI